jgi:hypothetical protein
VEAFEDRLRDQVENFLLKRRSERTSWGQVYIVALDAKGTITARHRVPMLSLRNFLENPVFESGICYQPQVIRNIC